MADRGWRQISEQQPPAAAVTTTTGSSSSHHTPPPLQPPSHPSLTSPTQSPTEYGVYTPGSLHGPAKACASAIPRVAVRWSSRASTNASSQTEGGHGERRWGETQTEVVVEGEHECIGPNRGADLAREGEMQRQRGGGGNNKHLGTQQHHHGGRRATMPAVAAAFLAFMKECSCSGLLHES